MLPRKKLIDKPFINYRLPENYLSMLAQQLETILNLFMGVITVTHKKKC